MEKNSAHAIVLPPVSSTLEHPRVLPERWVRWTPPPPTPTSTALTKEGAGVGEEQGCGTGEDFGSGQPGLGGKMVSTR